MKRPVRTMKRFLLFVGRQYYPVGGWDDFVGSYDTLKEAEDALLGVRKDWWQIVDGEKGEQIATG